MAHLYRVSWPTVIAWLCITVFSAHSITSMIGSGDTWVAMAAGRHIHNHGVSTIDPFSYNSLPPGPSAKEIEDWPPLARWIAGKVSSKTLTRWHPTGWINQNWLSHLFFYRLTTGLGSEKDPFMDALVYWKLLVYFLAAVFMYIRCRIMGCGPILASLGACTALFIGRSLLGIRPTDFTNLLSTVFMLILVLTAYRRPQYIWLLVPLTVLWCNLHGGFIYLFIMLVPFIFISLFTQPHWHIAKTMALHTIGAGTIALIAAVLFNPYHLSNFTHILEISVGQGSELWRLIDEWQPAFDDSIGLGNTRPFLYLIILAGLMFAAWIALKIHAGRRSGKSPRAGNLWSVKPLALWGIALISVYMAIRSRRFIPIAAFTLSPLLMLLLNDFFSAIKQPSVKLKRIVLCVCTVGVVVFAFRAGVQYHRSYVGPWPYAPNRTSVFMRLTASYQMPFTASEFIDINNMQGRLFNYWTDGGFLGWSQNIDATSGQPNMQVFIDGRAQAAYSIEGYEIYHFIWNGGNIGQEILTNTISPSMEAWQAAASWMDTNLRAIKIWAALVPREQYLSNFYTVLNYSSSWQPVFMDNNYTLFTDTSDERGRQLFEGIGSGATRYPNSFTRNLNQGHYKLLRGKFAKERAQGLEQLIAAFDEYPSKAPLVDIIQTASRFPRLQATVTEFSENRLNDFERHKPEYEQRNGYALHLFAMKMLCEYVHSTALKREDSSKADLYAEKSAQYDIELHELGLARKW